MLKNISRLRYLLLSSLAAFLLLLCTWGCIKDAPLNVEADILKVLNPEADFFAAAKISNSELKLFLDQDKQDIHAYAFEFSVSRGATSQPSSGSIQDFSQPVDYVITSENGEFKKTYRVSATDEKVIMMPLTFDFESYKIDEQFKYTIFFDRRENKALETWSSGNAGFVLSLSPLVTKQPKLYPMQFTEEAHTGKYAAKLETKSTGVFGSGAKKPIAAGNIFIGFFDASNVLGDPLRSTKFGMSINQAPLSLEGYYNYSAGKKVIDQNSKPLALADSCSLVAVLFDSEALLKSSGSEFLDGTNILTDKSIVAKGEFYAGSSSDKKVYTAFSIPLVYKIPAAQLDYSTGRYKLAIVLSASKNGDRFVGAVGSVLLIDDLKINVQ